MLNILDLDLTWNWPISQSGSGGASYVAFLRSKAFSTSYPSQFCPSVTRVDQSKMVQARITKSSPSAAWKTL